MRGVYDFACNFDKVYGNTYAHYFGIAPYTNFEVYVNSLVEDIMKGGNADAESTVDEYYPYCVKLKPTGINTPVLFSEEDDGAIYNLWGQRVNECYKGIVIKNGKKRIQK